MELLHHQSMPREEDNVFVCSRCGLENPPDDQPRIPVRTKPSTQEEAP